MVTYKEDLDNLFGFIERPRLSVLLRSLDGMLGLKPTPLFPTGHFVEVYYSEEFKYAHKIVRLPNPSFMRL